MTEMKRALVLIFIMILTSFPVSAEIETEYDVDELKSSIDPLSAWSKNYNVTALALISVSTKPYNQSQLYHITIHNATNFYVISRYNVTGDLFFNFIWEGLFRAYIWNPGGESLEISIILNSDSLSDVEGLGYSFDFEDNWCLQTTVSSGINTILPISSLTRGNFKIKLSSFGDNSNLRLYLTNENPSEEPTWMDSAIVISWIEYTEQSVVLDEGYNWIVLTSLDGLSHTVVIVMIYESGLALKTRDIIIAVVFIGALILFLLNQVTSRKKRRHRKSYYSTKPSRTDVQKQLHLISQVDIRHEGGRYVYIPPELTNPDLLDEGLVERKKDKDKT